MPKFKYNPRTGGIEIEQPELPTDRELLFKVSSYFRVSRDEDAEVLALIKKIRSGTRNVHYLYDSSKPRVFKDICNFLVRELSNN